MDKNRESNRRRFLRYSALAGIAGFLAGSVKETISIPTVRADDGAALIIGQMNRGSSTTNLDSDVTELFPTNGPALSVANTATAIPIGSRGAAVEGIALATSGEAFGVAGFTYSPDGQSVHGHALETSGQNTGVAGYSESPQGIGVQGMTMATTRGSWNPNSPKGMGISMGVLGYSQSPDGIGVRGACGSGIGVWGATHLTPGGVGVYASAGDTPIPIPLPPYPTGRALVVDGVASFSTAGAGLVRAKSSSVNIADTSVTGSSHVTITFTDNPGKGISVQWIGRKPGVGFTVNLTDKVARNTSFTYLIVEPN